MLRTLVLHITLCLIVLPLHSQASRKGVPLIRNYLPEEFRGTEQNWAIAQDDRGIMYFGNNDHGVMEYDGESWRHIRVPNNSIVRSLATMDGIVYVGNVDDFGYLAPDRTGTLAYRSLSVQLDSADRKFGDIWRIYFRGKEVFFSSDLDKLFVFENLVHKKTYSIPYSPLFTFCVDSVIYAGTFRAGLYILQNDTFVPAPNGDHFTRKSILSMLPHKNGLIQIGTIPGGITIYDPSDGELSYDFPSARANDFLAENLIYHAIPLPDDHFAYATLNRGVLIVDGKGDVRYVIDKVAGLQNEIVSCLFYGRAGSRAGPLWLALSSGISRIEIDSPFLVFGGNYGIKGSVLDIKSYRGRLYIGTLSGLFYFQENENQPPSFRPVREIDNACWSLLNFIPPGGDEMLVAATQRGVFEITDTNKIRCIEESISPDNPIYQQAFKLQASVHYPDRIYVGAKTGLVAFSYRGKWSKEKSFRSVPRYEVRSIAEAPDSSLWLGTLLNGVIRLKFQGNDTTVSVYDQGNNLPSVKNNMIFSYNNSLLFATRKGLYRFNGRADRFVPDSLFPVSYSDGTKGVYRFEQGEGDRVWTVVYTDEKSWVEKLAPGPGSSFTVDSLPYKRLPGREIDVIYCEPDETTWFGVSNRLFSYRGDPRRDLYEDFLVTIRKVTLNDEMPVFGGYAYKTEGSPSGETAPVPEFRYQFNNISFEFAAPFFIEESATMYSYFLEGLHKYWSRWSPDSHVAFNNLKEGKYLFRVKAKNIYDQESVVAAYGFVILPPAHRTAIAYLLYVLVLISSVWLIVKLYSRRLILEKQLLERIVSERTHEIMEQKKEIETQRDLAHRQKEQIEVQNIEIKDSIKYASRIQTAILPPGNVLADIFPDSFILNIPKDIVSGDFYWFSVKNNKITVAVADCTGHGVPGAFMSMLGMAFLNEIVNKSGIAHPAEILNQLRIHVINALHQKGEPGESQDGMDISLFSIDLFSLKLEFAGAYNALFLVRNKELTILRGDKMPIGISNKSDEAFTNQELLLEKNDVLYAFSDGYADQFGGKSDKKFTVRNMKNLILQICHRRLEEQKTVLRDTFYEWKGDTEQVDDILVVGMRIDNARNIRNMLYA